MNLDVIDSMNSQMRPDPALKEKLMRRAETEISDAARPMRRVPVRLKTALIAAAAILILAGTALAASGLWTPVLVRLLGAGEEMQVKLLDERVTVIPGVRGEDNGLEVTAEQMIGDRNGVRIILRLDMDGAGLSGTGCVVKYDLTVDDLDKSESLDYIAGGFAGWLDRDDSSDGGEYYDLCVYFRDDADISGHTLDLTIREITQTSVTESSMTETPVWTGEISLAIPMNYNMDTTAVFPVEESLDTGDGSVTVKAISLSPISAALEYTDETGAAVGGLQIAAMTMADGTVYDRFLDGAEMFASELPAGGRRMLYFYPEIIKNGRPTSVTLAVWDGDTGAWRTAGVVSIN